MRHGLLKESCLPHPRGKTAASEALFSFVKTVGLSHGKGGVITSQSLSFRWGTGNIASDLTRKIKIIGFDTFASGAWTPGC